MQDYHNYVHYVRESGTPKTSPVHHEENQKTAVVTKQYRETIETKHSALSMSPMKALYTTLAVAGKINSYVGELTENRVTARRTQIGLTYAGMGLAALTNPVTAGIAFAAYTGDKIISYQIKQYKENLSADYMRQLANGTVRTGR